MMLRVVIVDDEKKSRELLRNLLEEFCTDVHVEGVAGSVDEGIAVIRSVNPDLVFLDIEMQTSTGFDLLQKVGPLYFDVIFTTAYEQYAIKAIKYSALDYLLKPIDLDELKAAIEKHHQKKIPGNENAKLLQLLAGLKQKQPDKITLYTSEGMIFLEVDSIIRCEAQGAYTVFHIRGGTKIMASKNLREFENLLSDRGFFRIHNSHLV